MLRLLTKRTGIVTQGRSTRYQSNAITSLSFTGESTNKKPEAKALRDDVKDLGKILGACIKNNDPVVFDNVEKLRKLGRQVIIAFYCICTTDNDCLIVAFSRR